MRTTAPETATSKPTPAPTRPLPCPRKRPMHPRPTLQSLLAAATRRVPGPLEGISRHAAAHGYTISAEVLAAERGDQA